MSDRSHRRGRQGFVLLTILWVISVAAVVAMGAALVGRRAILAGAARGQLERARWEALACERRTIAAIELALDSVPPMGDAAAVWRLLPRAVVASPLLAGCDLAFEAAGTRLDLNGATEEMVVRLFDAIGLDVDAPQLAAALEDWIDSDDEPRSFGAERSWYESAGRFAPRNAALADPAELSRIRGFETIDGLDSVVSTSPGRVSLATAPVSVLMAVPGVTRETAEAIVALQRSGAPLGDLREIIGAVSQQSASELAARYPEAARVTTPDPDAWLVRARVRRGLPAVAVQLEWRIIRTGRHCVVESTRSTI